MADCKLLHCIDEKHIAGFFRPMFSLVTVLRKPKILPSGSHRGRTIELGTPPTPQVVFVRLNMPANNLLNKAWQIRIDELRGPARKG